MGKPSWQEFCVVCGGPPYADTSRCAAGQSGASRIPTAWLSDWVGVTPEQPDTPIPIGTYDSEGCWHTKPRRGGSTFAARGEYQCSIAPNQDRHNKLYGTPGSCQCVKHDDDSEDEDGWDDRVTCPTHAPKPGLHWLEDSWGDNTGWVRYGVAFHRSCGQVLQQRLGYRLNFNHVWPLLMKPQPSPAGVYWLDSPSTNHFGGRSYRGTERYHGGSEYPGEHVNASFLFSYVSAEDEYLLLDPLQCSGNADRIVRVWEPLVKQWRQQQQQQRRHGGTHPAAAAASSGQAAGGQRKGRGSDDGCHSSQGNAGSSLLGGIALGRGRRGAVGSRGGGSAGTAEAAAAAAAGGRPSRALQGKATRGADAKPKAMSAQEAAITVLQLVFTHAGSPKAQLALAAKLLPLSSTMPQLLAGCMQLAAAANTWPRVQQVARWLRSYGCLLNSLALDAVVDCCPWDAERSNTAVLKAIEEATTQHQGVRLVSLSLHIPLSADPLLQSLPLAHLTALHLPGPWELSAEAAAALAAATALQQLTLPGAGLGDALAADPGVLPAGLQRLRLCDAGNCSAATLRALSGQLSALTHLSLDYNPLGAKDDEAEGVVFDHHDSYDGSRVVREVRECWAELPALRSLRLGVRYARPLPDLDFDEEDGHPLGDPSLQHRYFHLEVCKHTLNSLAAVTGLTSLTLGPSAWLQAPEAGGSGLKRLVKPLQQLTGLRQLTLTLQVMDYEDADRLDQKRRDVMLLLSCQSCDTWQ